MSYPKELLASPILDIHWSGWRANSIDLYKNGWQFQVDYDIYAYQNIVAIFSPDGSFKSYCRVAREDIVRSKMEFVPVSVHMVVGRLVTHTLYADSFRIADMSESYVGYDRGMRELFKKETPRQPELILPSDSVPDLMDRILELQNPDRQARIKKQVKEQESSKILYTANVVNLR